MFARPRIAAALLLALLSLPTALAAQSVTGRVTADGGTAADVQIVAGPLSSPLAGTLSRDDGRFLLTGLPAGEVRLTFRSLGYETVERTVTVPSAGTVEVEVALVSSALEMNPIVVTGTLREQRVQDSPVKVEVVSQRALQRNASASLMDAIGTINGLTAQVDCGVCYTNSIRINGMEGPYTAVLIDGMPIMGALASVYGLNGIDPALIERIEILKGPQSTLYGTEAMGGVVNVITKDARFAPRYALDASFSDLGQRNVMAAWAPSTGGVDALLSGSLQHNDRFVDRNGDAFSDLTLDTRLSFFGKTSVFRNGIERLGLTAKLYHEDRFGGVEAWTPADRGSSSVYGESIETRRLELLGRARLGGDLRMSGSYTWHDQDSYYGDTRYAARQDIAFGQLLWDPAERRDVDLLAGLTARWQRYDDETPATAQADRRFIPGVFAEATVFPTPAVALLLGGRVDHQGDHGAIFAPRATVKVTPWTNGTLRGSFGTGFRVVNLFTEDHAALTGAREVVIAEGLEPERSRSFALNYNQIIEFGVNNMMVDVDLFHTRFSNKIEPDYDSDPNRIVYANLDGRATSRGFAFAVNQNFGDTPFFYTVGVTVQDVYEEDDDGVRSETFFSPDFTASWTASWTFEQIRDGLSIDWTGSLVGPMRLPEFDEPFARPTRSDSYTTHDLQLSLAAGDGRELYLGVENLTGFRQDSPLIDPANPFGDAFDTSYAYAPVVGRRLFAGVRIAASR